MKWILLLVLFTGCKGYWETKLVTRENCEYKYPSVPCPPSIIIDSTFVTDTIIKVELDSIKFTLNLNNLPVQRWVEVIEDDRVVVKALHDTTSSMIFFELSHKPLYVPVTIADTTALMKLLRDQKSVNDSLYKETYYWKNAFNMERAGNESKGFNWKWLLLIAGAIIFVIVIKKI